MTTVFTENENRDIYLGTNKRLSVSTGLTAVLQACKAAVEIQQGEALFTQENGVPTDSVVWSGSPNFFQFEFFARKQILKVSETIAVDEFTVSQDGGTLQYQATIKTTYGTGKINGSV